ncbi:ABC transporter ATP-binding protein [Pseudobacter ginsenosidimutans]|uniref:Lipopolysaccharide transport system ATP-binding protein n=1 Tax=Pseudobacter ginsenosidimutans TaxID=661488 RepID=A0A4V2F1X2_9BACT|nr:ABC transporter ATP-binding protein [Pseudobacter ginsenosidimutans]QEC43844.1 ABC transporter ATP-binding protein [Pseudobacter ginsenosidimutans]RZS75266.1 lipopolysaccharide transport system ATP-binding protein [Pseudobacter ginsenosidimutans]
MSKIVIEAAGVSKIYRLGAIGTGSFRQDVKRWINKTMGQKNNAFFHEDKLAADQFMALKDISFQVRQGETWGIVGPNGAGKSTLLKIISRIIQPSSGFVRGRGTVGSLLEVGTGFHPELSGRENIYISGSLLGMTKAQVLRQFDEIVAFSGLEKFIDTPVKRYSSGMYVRLAFAVAAHLNADILIMDEVLAVGDIEFQKRCLDKMQEVAKDSQRTILFVSHNMQAVSHLCRKAIWLQQGAMMAMGDTSDVVEKYIGSLQQNKLHVAWGETKEAPGNEYVRILSMELVPQLLSAKSVIDIRTPLTVKFTIRNQQDNALLNAGLHLFNYAGECIFDVASLPVLCSEGAIQGECQIPGNFLNDGAYYLSLIIVQDTSIPLFYYEGALHFEVADFRENTTWFGKWKGAVRPQFPFRFEPSIKQAIP